MIQRENSGQLPPFWEVHLPQGGAAGNLQYVNTLTNYVTHQRPAPLR